MLFLLSYLTKTKGPNVTASCNFMTLRCLCGLLPSQNQTFESFEGFIDQTFGHLTTFFPFSIWKRMKTSWGLSFRLPKNMTLDAFKKATNLPWLVWFSGLSTSLQTKELLVQFLVRTHAWVAGQVPSRDAQETTTHWCFSLSLSPSLLLCLKINNLF